ncbi:hypothetical protein J2Z35_001095 [Acetoanaerobium pronyense]|uniref:Uncharacterized protein n=1 Tax=Acetoanaerobium pronyense TaxID=1482736 RepID=A0ABS4KJJ4_9FIRM|nr:hypothetical protein [Acetoanaerobium pronyense]MBP2027301.1 hypothetical protein [Acetoanaerobium pronyense]
MNAYYFSIIIYLYYLAYKEKLAEENLKIFSQNILKEYQKSISEYLLCTYLEDLTINSTFDLIRQNLNGWELMPEYDRKSMILDDIIDVFLIYYAIYTEKNIDSLRESIKVILGTNIFSFLNNVPGPQKVSTIESYKKFIKTIFYEDLAEGDIEDDLNRFVEILVDIYKSKEIEDAKLEALDKKEIVRYENLLNKKVVEKIIKPFKIFNLKDEENIEKFSFHRSVFADAKILEKILDEVIERLYYEFTEFLLKFLIEKHQIDYKEVLFNDENALIYLFDLIESHDIKVNTLIGYKSKFSSYEKELEFKKLEDKSNKIKTPQSSNIVVAIDSNEILINFTKCEIEIKDINLEEKFEKLEKDDKGRLLYNITNDIIIPFEREELQSLISDTQKEISLKIEYQYQVNEKISGAAITFRPKKYFETK